MVKFILGVKLSEIDLYSSTIINVLDSERS